VTEPHVALVTGAGRGIGRAVAIRLSGEGLRVVLTARSEDELAATAEQCRHETLTVPADITEPDAAERIFAAAEERWSRVDVLVANAGAGSSAPLGKIGDADWAHMLELNLTAPFRCVRRAAPSMKAAGFGRIVVVASVAARVGEPYIAAYTASKHGVLGLVRSAAAELAATGVTVNAVCPGYVDTPMTDETIANVAATSGRDAADVRAILAGKQPVGRLIAPDEVAEAVSFCLRMPSMTGQGIVIDGGAVQA
jgi:NAD(P)-dependent dehydrogenase (short-subunit alcohol dehydrogenase family)